jgi:glycosyltransferase involved in cell wall biosynthesis
VTEQAAIRVCVVDGYGVLGGAESWLLAVLGAAPGLDAHVVLLRDGPERERLEQLGLAVEVLSTGRTPIALVRSGLRLRKVLRRHHSSVVLANGVKAATVAAIARRGSKSPVVWVKHDFSRDQGLGRRVARHVDVVVGTSRAVVAAIGRADAEVLPPPRPADPPATRDDARTFWAAKGVGFTSEPIAVFVGRLTPYKRVEDVIQAVTVANNWRLVVVGADDWSMPGESARLRNLAERAGVLDRVTMVGEVPDAGHWLAAFDALVLPTSVDAAGYGGEGFGIVVLESVLAGVPVVATAGIPALDDVGEAAIAVARERPDEIADALAQVRERTPAAQAKAAELITNYPDAATVARRLVTILDGAAA